MSRKASENPRRIMTNLAVNEEEKALVLAALELVRKEIPGFAEISVMSFVRFATLYYANKVIADKQKADALEGTGSVS